MKIQNFCFDGIIITARYISDEKTAANGAYVGLAAPGKDGSFQKEAKVLISSKNILIICLDFINR